jgi:hypothetical protein
LNIKTYNLEENNKDNNKKRNDMEISRLTDEVWVKRLDMAFDQSNVQGVILKESEIAEYVDFNKKYLEKIDYFIENIKKLGYLFVCEPEQISFEKSDFFEEKPFKAEIILTKLNRIDFNKVIIINYGYGDPNKISDIYEVELETSKGKIINYDLSGMELVRFYYQGSLVHKDGDIIAINVQKAMDALNKYYG